MFKNRISDKYIDRKRLRRRYQTMDANFHENTPRSIIWKMLSEFLEKNEGNGGFSRFVLNDSDDIIGAAMLPHNARLLLQSNAMFPVVLIDGNDGFWKSDQYSIDFGMGPKRK